MVLVVVDCDPVSATMWPSKSIFDADFILQCIILIGRIEATGKEHAKVGEQANRGVNIVDQNIELLSDVFGRPSDRCLAIGEGRM